MFPFSDTGEATLRIISVASEDDGVYTCIATNELGSTTSSASLRVLGKAAVPAGTARPPTANVNSLCLVLLQLCPPTVSESSGRTISSLTTPRWLNWAGAFISMTMATTYSWKKYDFTIRNVCLSPQGSLFCRQVLRSARHQAHLGGQACEQEADEEGSGDPGAQCAHETPAPQHHQPDRHV